jgi:hypothetical protein
LGLVVSSEDDEKAVVDLYLGGVAGCSFVLDVLLQPLQLRTSCHLAKDSLRNNPYS